jgi:myo-inositol-1(or 4)-monophosphatase
MPVLAHGPHADARPGAGRSPSALLDIAIAAAVRSSDVLQARAGDRAALRWEEKKHADFVTEVDRASEEELRAVIRDLAPEARVLGEELSPTLGGSTPVADLAGIVFVADPLDGTTNYLHGYPAYAVSIGVIVDGVLTAGVVRHAVTGDSYTAIAGEGAYRNGERITVDRKSTRLNSSHYATVLISRMPSDRKSVV